MARGLIGCGVIPRVVLLTVLVGLMPGAGSAVGAGAVAAQGGAFDCAVSAASPVASPAASSGTPAPVATASFPADGGSLTVFAAASLADAFNQMKDDLEAANEGLTITYNFAGSQALVTQLNEGAAADLFASANRTQMDIAVENGSIAGDPVTFVRNRLAVVVPGDNPAELQTPADLAKDGLRLVLAQAEVPVGRYSREAVCQMGQDPTTYGEGFAERVAANVVSEEEDVRDVLTKVLLGEADAGIVYVSDAASAEGEVELIEIPDAVNVVATYPIAAVEGGDEALAEAFIAYILSPEGQATLEEYGFEPLT